MNKLLSIHMLFNQCPHLHDTLCMNYHIQDIQIEIHQHNRYNIRIVLGNIFESCKVISEANYEVI